MTAVSAGSKSVHAERVLGSQFTVNDTCTWYFTLVREFPQELHLSIQEHSTLAVDILFQPVNFVLPTLSTQTRDDPTLS